MTAKTHPKWQALFTAGTTKMYSDRNVSYEDALDMLPPGQRDAILLGQLNYQVQNGGFAQWVDNGYGTQLVNVRRVVGRIESDAAEAVVEMLDQLAEHVRSNVKHVGFGGTYWIDEPEECDMDEHKGYELSEKLTNEYYRQNTEFEDAVEAYLAQKFNDDGTPKN